MAAFGRIEPFDNRSYRDIFIRRTSQVFEDIQPR